MQSETPLVRDVIYDLGKLLFNGRRACPIVRRRTVGRFRTLDGRRTVNVGEKGEPDIDGILWGGRGFFVECKMPEGGPEPEQLAFREAILASGALYVLASSREFVIAQVLKALRDRDGARDA